MKTLGDFFWLIWLAGYFAILISLQIMGVESFDLALILIAWSLLVPAFGGVATFIRERFLR